MEAPTPERSPTSPEGLVKSELAHPIALDLLMLKRFGPEWLDWDILVVERALDEAFGVRVAPDHVLNKLQACRTLHVVDTFWTDWHIFSPCVMALNGAYPDFREMQTPTAGECLMAADCAVRIRDDIQYSLEVRTYIGVLFRHDDMLVPQEPLLDIPIDTEGVDVDVPEIGRQWPEVRRTGQVTARDPRVRGQLERMLGCYRYLEDWRALLDQQLKVLR